MNNKNNKQLLREYVGLLLEVPIGLGMRKPRFGLSDTGRGPAAKFNPDVHTINDVMDAVMQEFNGVASDLGVDDPSDPAFIDYIGDRLSDVMPLNDDIVDQVVARLKKGKTR